MKKDSVFLNAEDPKLTSGPFCFLKPTYLFFYEFTE
jgi:hypothetical protein